MASDLHEYRARLGAALFLGLGEFDANVQQHRAGTDQPYTEAEYEAALRAFTADLVDTAFDTQDPVALQGAVVQAAEERAQRFAEGWE